MLDRIYLVVDLKSFYASVECVERKLEPFKTNLIVADASRGKGAICLAVSPAMKKLGVKNRCRIYEIPSNIKHIIAKPRMSKYIEYSANIYAIYLKYIAKEDIYPYSIDECFLDVTKYLKTYKKNALQLAKIIMQDILDTYKITATCGIGTNMYLAKIALDIMSKHSNTNIGWLNKERYIEKLGNYKNLSKFWQIGKKTEIKLNKMGLYTMNDIANCKEEELYKEFGVNALFLIDHSKGIEPCTIADIKAYKPKNKSMTSSQILFEDYNYEKAKLILKEMVELLAQKLIENEVITDSIKLSIGYSKDVIKSTQVSKILSYSTNLYTKLVSEFMMLYIQTTDKTYPIRKISISFNRLQKEETAQINIFDNILDNQKEKEIEKTIIEIKSKMGKNSILKGINLEKGATTKVRNTLIGGHSDN